MKLNLGEIEMDRPLNIIGFAGFLILFAIVVFSIPTVQGQMRCTWEHPWEQAQKACPDLFQK